MKTPFPTCLLLLDLRRLGLSVIWNAVIKAASTGVEFKVRTLRLTNPRCIPRSLTASPASAMTTWVSLMHHHFYVSEFTLTRARALGMHEHLRKQANDPYAVVHIIGC